MEKENCVFCKIVAGEIPAYKVWENDKILAFLDLGSISQGHTLVIPKKHFADIFEIEDEDLEELVGAVKEISGNIKKNLGATGVNLLNASGKDAQQSVFHFHMHIVPRYENDGLNTWPKSNYKENAFEHVAKKIRG